MTTTRPLIWPLHDRLGINEVPIESSLYTQNGYPTGLPVPSGDHNGKMRRAGQWHQYMDLNGLRNEDWLDVSAMSVVQLSAGPLTYNVGENVLTTGATVLSRATYLIEGTRVETDTAFLNPLGGTINGDPLVYTTATVPGRIWVYSDASGNVRYESAAAGAADSPASDEQALVGLDINALGVVTDGAVAPTAQPLPASRSLSVTIPIDFTGALTATGTGTMLAVTGGQVTGGNPAMTLAAGIGPALTVTSTSPTDVAVSIVNNLGGIPLVVEGTAIGGAVSIVGNTGLGVAVSTTGALAGIEVGASGAGEGIDVQHAGSGVGINCDTSGGSGVAAVLLSATSAMTCSSTNAAAQVLVSTTGTGQAVRGVATSTGVGLAGVGGAAAISLGVFGVATHVDAYGIEGQTAAAANAAAAGVRGLGLGAGVGLFGQASGTGYGAVFLADTTSPTRAAVRQIPQDADPTTGEQGARLFNSSRGPTGKERVYTTQWESVHSSALGQVATAGLSASGSLLAGASIDLSLAQISPEEVGRVVITVTAYLSWAVDTASTTVQIRDDDAGTTINGGGTGVVEYPIVGAVGRGHSVVARINYTLPNANTRTFSARLTAAVGTTTYTDVTVTVAGVY